MPSGTMTSWTPSNRVTAKRPRRLSVTTWPAPPRLWWTARPERCPDRAPWLSCPDVLDVAVGLDKVDEPVASVAFIGSGSRAVDVEECLAHSGRHLRAV